MNNQTIQFLAEATLLNRESQPLSTGQAILYPILRSGEFLPQRESLTVTLDSLPQQASILKASDSHLYRLRLDMAMCQGKNKPDHFHFDYESIDEP